MTKKRTLDDNTLTIFQNLKQRISRISPKKILISISGHLAIFALVITAVHYYQTQSTLNPAEHLKMPVSQLPLVTGETLNTRSLNDKPTVYYFFAPWCKVCEYSIDNLTALEPQWREDKVNVLIIALDYSSLNEVTAYIDRHQLPFPVALGSRTIAERYKINGYPTYYIADAEGILNWVSVGYSTELGLITRLQLL